VIIKKMTHEDKMDEIAGQVWTRLIANCVILLTIVGAILSRMDIIDVHSTLMGIFLGLSVLALVYLAMQRSTSLPFLGPSVIPPSLLGKATSSPMADIEVDVSVDSRSTHVAYWAADPANDGDGTHLDQGPRQAYTRYTNSGISPVNGGAAVLRLQCPGEYAVRGKLLPKHIHYREVYPSGIMGEVKKANVVCS